VINVAVTADGRYALEKNLLTATSAEGLASELTKAVQNREDTLLVINADAQSPHQAVISVMEAARLAGIVRISFATQRAAGRR
jgi:biopolymer transport protein ExbD